ncbi:hypothetical protein BC829DRAFT_449253 [Chytridium lagenaria]|nr:hypothetical protein BC829DRAFT_449253 [Chytridium lagenaria]
MQGIKDVEIPEAVEVFSRLRIGQTTIFGSTRNNFETRRDNSGVAIKTLEDIYKKQRHRQPEFREFIRYGRVDFYIVHKNFDMEPRKLAYVHWTNDNVNVDDFGLIGFQGFREHTFHDVASIDRGVGFWKIGVDRCIIIDREALSDRDLDMMIKKLSSARYNAANTHRYLTASKGKAQTHGSLSRSLQHELSDEEDDSYAESTVPSANAIDVTYQSRAGGLPSNVDRLLLPQAPSTTPSHLLSSPALSRSDPLLSLSAVSEANGDINHPKVKSIPTERMSEYYATPTILQALADVDTHLLLTASSDSINQLAHMATEEYAMEKKMWCTLTSFEKKELLREFKSGVKDAEKELLDRGTMDWAYKMILKSRLMQQYDESIHLGEQVAFLLPQPSPPPVLTREPRTGRQPAASRPVSALDVERQILERTRRPSIDPASNENLPPKKRVRSEGHDND